MNQDDAEHSHDEQDDVHQAYTETPKVEGRTAIPVEHATLRSVASSPGSTVSLSSKVAKQLDRARSGFGGRAKLRASPPVEGERGLGIPAHFGYMPDGDVQEGPKGPVEGGCTCDPDDATSRDHCAVHSPVEGEDERVWTIGKWGRSHSLVISGPDTGPGESSTEVVEVVPASLASQLKAERDELKAARGTIRATVEQELHELTTRAEAAEARIAELEAEKEKLAQELSDQANALADEYRGEELESYYRGWAAGNAAASAKPVPPWLWA
jgi:hypothetical protein